MNISVLNWAEVKNKIETVNKNLFDLLSGIQSELPKFYLCSYHYGEHIVENGLFHCVDKKSYPEIHYTTIPLMLSLNKSTTFSDQDKPQFLYKKGDMFGLRQFGVEFPELYSNVNLHAGSRSVFLTQKFSNSAYFKRLNKYFNLNLKPTQNHQEHFEIFKELSLVDSQLMEWEAEFIVFSKEWVNKILYSTEYNELHQFITHSAAKRIGYFLNLHNRMATINQALSTSLKKMYFKYDFELVDILEQILLVNHQCVLGFYPVLSEDDFPIHRMKELLETCYDKRKWVVFMHLANIDTINVQPVYFSLGSLHLAMKGDQELNVKSNLTLLKKIEYVIKRLEIIDEENFVYIHPMGKKMDNIIKPSCLDDKKFLNTMKGIDDPFKTIFWKGLVQINTKRSKSIINNEQSLLSQTKW